MMTSLIMMIIDTHTHTHTHPPTYTHKHTHTPTHTSLGSLFSPMIADRDNNVIFFMESATITLLESPDVPSEQIDLPANVENTLEQLNISVTGKIV